MILSYFENSLSTSLGSRHLLFDRETIDVLALNLWLNSFFIPERRNAFGVHSVAFPAPPSFDVFLVLPCQVFYLFLMWKVKMPKVKFLHVASYAWETLIPWIGFLETCPIWQGSGWWCVLCKRVTKNLVHILERCDFVGGVRSYFFPEFHFCHASSQFGRETVEEFLLHSLFREKRLFCSMQSLCYFVWSLR